MSGLQHEVTTLNTSVVQAAAIKDEIGTDYAPAAMRQRLFHGTSAVESIIGGHSAGFLPLLSGTTVGAIWGDGTYFARDAKYSDDFALRLPNGLRQVLVADVVLGRTTVGKRGMKVYPQLPGEQYRRYNSLSDDQKPPSIFVVQHSSQ